MPSGMYIPSVFNAPLHLLCSYPFNHVPSTAKPSRDEFSSHENCSDGQLVLGHASPLNAFLLSHDEKFIITADRDEHIRVSWYPQGYNIEIYCLGHQKYVCAICIPEYAPGTLISGGGDPCLKLWNWMSGECTGEVQIWEFVEPFIAVKTAKQKGPKGEDEGDERGTSQKRKGKGKKSKRSGSKHKVGQPEVQEGGRYEEEIDEGEVGKQASDGLLELVEEKVLVVNKIKSVCRGDTNFIVFGAVGATALFIFQYPTGSVEHLDFGHPVIDFAICNDGKVWVSLDTTLSPTRPEPLDTRCSIRVVQVVEHGGFAKAELTDENQALLESLNEITRFPLGSVPNKLPDFYVDLKTMPKWSEPSALLREMPSKCATESVTASDTGKSLTRREEGRMKNKRNVLAKMQEVERGSTSKLSREKEKVGTVRPYEDVNGDEEGREAKRVKSVVEGSGAGADVEMEP